MRWAIGPMSSPVMVLSVCSNYDNITLHGIKYNSTKCNIMQA